MDDDEREKFRQRKMAQIVRRNAQERPGCLHVSFGTCAGFFIGPFVSFTVLPDVNTWSGGINALVVGVVSGFAAGIVIPLLLRARGSSAR